MEIIYSDENINLNNSVVVLGNFDGVHYAHRKLVEKAVCIAKEKNLKVVVYTFSQHPKKLLGKKVEILTTNSEKEALFNKMGVDILVYQKADMDFLGISPEEFVESIVIRKLGAKCVVVGKHYSFGANAKGTSETLKIILNGFSVETYIEELVEMDGSIISSSRIRELLKNGNVSQANTLLGRAFSVEGTVVHGNHLGTGIGFPTANINFDEGKIVPKYGVYAGKATVDGVTYNAVVNIGVKPTVGCDVPLLEAHIIGASLNFYGRRIVFELFEFLREERKYDSLDELKKQIRIDLQNTIEYFK